MPSMGDASLIPRMCCGCPCYLSRPSGLMVPSSDLGSGDSELQEVLLQSSKGEQLEGLAIQRPATDQKLLMLLSVQFSRAWPKSCACCWEARPISSKCGRFRIPARPWKFCSMYSFRGGPAWSHLPSSESEHTQRQREGEEMSKDKELL